MPDKPDHRTGNASKPRARWKCRDDRTGLADNTD
jgi:hypothetical protein